MFWVNVCIATDSVSAARHMSQSLLFSNSCSWRLPSGAVEEPQVPSLNSVRLRPSAHRCSCSRNPPIPANGAQIGYRRIGNGRPLLVLNGFAATSADWDPSFIDRLASSNELILVNNRGIGGSTDDGQAFDIARLADDTAHVIENLGVERVSVLGWSMGGFIAQALALNYADHIDKLVLLSTDCGGIEADLASPDVWSKLIDTSGTPNEQARRLLFLLFPTDVAKSVYRLF